MIKKSALLLLLTVSVVLSGCSNQTETIDIENQKKASIQAPRENLILKDEEIINIAGLELNGGIFDTENKLRYYLVFISGRIDAEKLDFIPCYLEVTNTNIGFMKNKPISSDLSSNPYPLESKYSFNENTEDYSFDLYIKVPTSDTAAREIISNPQQSLRQIKCKVLEIIDGETISVIDKNGNDKTYFLTVV